MAHTRVDGHGNNSPSLAGRELGKKDLKRLKGLSLARAGDELGWSYRNIRPLVAFLHGEYNPPFPGVRAYGQLTRTQRNRKRREDARAKRDWNMNLAAQSTIADVLSKLNTSYDIGDQHQAVVRRMRFTGFTMLDARGIPSSSVSFAQLKKMSRAGLLKTDAFALGTVPWGVRTLLDFPTIADLLKVRLEALQYYGKGAAKTYLMLKRLGFGPNDGLLMQGDPLESFAKTLYGVSSLSLREARKFAVVAAERNWI